MATPADQRLLELLDKWLSSLELHAKYASLDDETYSSMQPWPEHQRPSRWIIDLAKQRALALRAQIQERVEMADAKFSDSLELMIFLANLVGSEHIERFIPLAHADNPFAGADDEPDGKKTLAGQDIDVQAVGTPHVDAAAAHTATTVTQQATASREVMLTREATVTREMPKFSGKQRAPAPASTAHVARAERKSVKTPPRSGSMKEAPAAKSGAKLAAAAPAKLAPTPTANLVTDAGGRSTSGASGSTHDKSGPSDAAREQVIADAARLVQWGRKWYELAELIASMADRPHLVDVRRILKDSKAIIDKKAGRT